MFSSQFWTDTEKGNKTFYMNTVLHKNTATSHVQETVMQEIEACQFMANFLIYMTLDSLFSLLFLIDGSKLLNVA